MPCLGKAVKNNAKQELFYENLKDKRQKIKREHIKKE